MSIAKIGDTHVGSRSGSQHVRDFIKSYLINYFIPEVQDAGIKKIFSMGDFFDVRKFMYGRDKDWLDQELIPALRAAGITWDGIIGNHDITLADDNRINWPSYLQDTAPDVFTFYAEPTVVEYDGVPVLLMPWINKTNYEQCLKAIVETTAEYMFGHLELEGFQMYQGSVCTEGQISVELLRKFKRVDTGHFHTRSQDGNIRYLGSPYHLTWEDYKDGTNRGFYIDDLVKNEVMFIENMEHQSMFRVVEYDYSKLENDEKAKANWKDPEWLNDSLGLRGQIVRIVVENRDNSRHYQSFTDAIKRVQCIDYNFIDKTVTVQANEVTVTEEMIATDAVEVIKKDINDSPNIERKNNVCKLAEAYYTQAQQKMTLDA